jgi:Domain of unknown function (DUF222)
MTTATHRPDGAHPIVWFGARVHAVLDDLTDVPAWSMTAAEQRIALIDLARAEARIDELRLRVLAAADRNDIAAEDAATSTAAWLAVRTGTTHAEAHADVKLALALDTDYPQTRRALAAGHVNPAQARVIVRALTALPNGIDASLRERAEKQLLADAADHDANALRLLGRRVFEVVDPDAADLEEGRRLEREEQAAARATYLHLCDNRDGTHTGRFKISTLHAEMLKKALHALTAPAQQRAGARAGAQPGAGAQVPAPTGDSAPEQKATRPERMGHAFCELLERFPARRLPKAGGTSATVLVMLDYDKLLTGLGAAHLDTGVPISAGEARRLACTSGLIPVVYRRAIDGRSVVLDMGRRRRLHDEYQRIAFAVRDRGCTTVGCDRPAAWCHAHHDIPWSEGGGTSVAHGRLLCGFHHRKAHSPTYTMTHRHDGEVEFHRRT